jgi:integrase
MARKRRGRGEGGISERKDGTFAGSVSLGHGPDGKRRREWVYAGTKGEVLAKLDRLRTKVAPGVLLSKMSLGDWLARWLTEVQVAPSTLDNYTRFTELHLIPNAAGIRLDRMTPLDVQTLYSRLPNLGATRQKCHRILHKALDTAVRAGLMARNPAALVDSPRHTPALRQPFSLDQAKTFLAAIRGDRFEALYLLAVAGGFREGELFDLEWRDVSLEAGVVRVRRGKTKASVRPVPIPPIAVAALAALQHRKGRVFTNGAGNRLDRPGFLQRRYYPLLEKAGLPRITFHDLRHTHATLLLAAGVNPKVVQERLGHSSVIVTLDLYGHVVPTMQQHAVDTAEDLFGGG